MNTIQRLEKLKLDALEKIIHAGIEKLYCLADLMEHNDHSDLLPHIMIKVYAWEISETTRLLESCYKQFRDIVETPAVDMLN